MHDTYSRQVTGEPINRWTEKPVNRRPGIPWFTPQPQGKNLLDLIILPRKLMLRFGCRREMAENFLPSRSLQGRNRYIERQVSYGGKWILQKVKNQRKTKNGKEENSRIVWSPTPEELPEQPQRWPTYTACVEKQIGIRSYRKKM